MLPDSCNNPCSGKHELDKATVIPFPQMMHPLCALDGSDAVVSQEELTRADPNSVGTVSSIEFSILAIPRP